MNIAPERERTEIAVLTPDGDLDLSNVGAVERELSRSEARRPAGIVLDLRDVSFLDSSGLRLIVGAHARAQRDGRRFVVAVASDAVRRVFRITLLEWRLEIVDDPADVVVDGAGDPKPR